MNINDFEKLQSEIERELTFEEFNMFVDMLTLQDIFFESDINLSIPTTDGLRVLKSGEVVFVNQEEVKYQKALKKQKKKPNLYLVK